MANLPAFSVLPSLVGYEELSNAFDIPAPALRACQSAGFLPVRSIVRGNQRCFDLRDVALVANIRAGVDVIEGVKT